MRIGPRLQIGRRCFPLVEILLQKLSEKNVDVFVKWEASELYVIDEHFLSPVRQV